MEIKWLVSDKIINRVNESNDTQKMRDIFKKYLKVKGLDVESSQIIVSKQNNCYTQKNPKVLKKLYDSEKNIYIGRFEDLVNSADPRLVEYMVCEPKDFENQFKPNQGDISQDSRLFFRKDNSQNQDWKDA